MNSFPSIVFFLFFFCFLFLVLFNLVNITFLLVGFFLRQPPIFIFSFGRSSVPRFRWVSFMKSVSCSFCGQNPCLLITFRSFIDDFPARSPSVSTRMDLYLQIRDRMYPLVPLDVPVTIPRCVSDYVKYRFPD